jgi:hypothetical protein
VVAALEAREARGRYRIDHAGGTVDAATVGLSSADRRCVRFTARLAPLANAVSHLAESAWPALVDREVDRWLQAADRAMRPSGDDESLRVRLIDERRAVSSTVRRGPNLPPGVVWEAMVDHGDLVLGPAQPIGQRGWDRAVVNSVSRAVDGLAHLDVGGVGGGARCGAGDGVVGTVVAGPYAATLLLDPALLASIRPSSAPGGLDQVRRRVWVVSNTLLLVVDGTADGTVNTAGDGTIDEILGSLWAFARSGALASGPFPIEIRGGRGP